MPCGCFDYVAITDFSTVTDVSFNVFLRCTYSLFIGDPYCCVTELIHVVARNTGMLAFMPIVTSVFTFENESRYKDIA